MAIGVDPTDLSGCIAWGTAADLPALADGDPVTAWPSRVGPSLTSTAGGVPPVFVAAGQGGLPGVRFDVGSVLRNVAVPGGFAAGGSGCTLLVFARSRQAAQASQVLTITTPTAGNARYRLSLTVSGSTSAIVGGGRRLDTDALTGTSGTGVFGWSVLDALEAHCLSGIFDHVGTTLQLQQDGAPVHSSTTWTAAGTASSTTPAVLALGCAPDTAASGFVGDIYEWAVFSRALSQGEVGRIAGRWMDRYGLAPAPVSPPSLPWALDLAALRASARQTTGCWYSPCPTSRDNAAQPDVWQNSFVSPDGQSGAYASIGGLWRDRPKIRAPRPQSNWWLRDAVDTAQGLLALGFDGAATDVISLTAEFGRHWTFNRVHAMAGVLTGFRVPFFLDGDGFENKYTAAQSADMIQTIDSYRSGWYLPDGRTVIYVFAPELCALPGQTPIGTVSTPASESSTMRVYFDALDAELRGRGITPAWLFAPISGWTNYKDALRPLVWSGSWWGSGNPSGSRNASTDAAVARADGFEAYAQPVKHMDVRPRDRLADEAGGTENLRTQIDGAITAGADILNVTTLNDYNENTHIEPSELMGAGWGVLISWWLAKWKLGSPPPIVREGVAVIHRRQPKAAVPTDTRNTSLMAFRSGTASRDAVEVCTWLTAASTITVRVGTTTTTIQAPAGFSTRTVPLVVGAVTAAVTRVGVPVVSVTSDIPITSSPTVQDLNYYPRLAVADPPPPVAVGSGPAEIVLDRVFGGTGRRVITEMVRPSGIKRVDIIRPS